ncbi:MAG: ABC transporter permease, partial [Liquorilactobacillus satsumensis]
MSIIGVCLFFISLFGYKNLLERLGVPRYLSWISGMIVQTLLLYIMVMSGALIVGIKVVTILGCSLFITCSFAKLKNIKANKDEKLHFYDIWMFVIGVLFLNVLSKSSLIHYDNYSNWATIIKFMLFQGHLPTNDMLITFTSYPPAAGLFVTQFVYLVGFSNSTMLIGQFLLIWASLYAIFSVLRDKTRGLNSGILCFAISLTSIFNISIRTNNLLVDYLLPVITAAAFAGIYVYRKRVALQMLHVILFCSMLLLIKNSGIFFVILISLFYIYWLLKEHGENKVKYFCAGVLSIFISFIPFVWWQYHVRVTFNSVANHAISTSAYKQQLIGESKSYLYQVFSKIVNHFFNVTTMSTQGFILINTFLIISWVIIRFGVKKPNNLLKVLFCLDFIFIAYCQRRCENVVFCRLKNAV